MEREPHFLGFSTEEFRRRDRTIRCHLLKRAQLLAVESVVQALAFILMSHLLKIDTNETFINVTVLSM